MSNKNDKIRVLHVEVGQYPKVVEITPTLEEMQRLVNGCIEPFYPYEEQVCIVCNDEGKINGMLPNRFVFNEDREIVDLVFGSFFICDCSTSSFGSLTDEQIARYRKEFYHPARMGFIDGKLVVTPYEEKQVKTTKSRKNEEREER